MSIKAAIISRLVGNTAVKEIVGNRVRANRSHAGDSLPRIIIDQIDADHAEHLTAATGKAIGRFQINCYANTPKQANKLATAVREALHCWRGEAADVWISMITLADERDSYQEALPGQDAEGGIDGVQLDFRIGWTTSIPSF